MGTGLVGHREYKVKFPMLPANSTSENLDELTLLLVEIRLNVFFLDIVYGGDFGREFDLVVYLLFV